MNGLSMGLILLNLLIIVFVLDRLLHRPVSKYLEARRERIRKELDEANESREQANQLKKSFEEKMQDADAICNEKLATANEQARVQSQNMLSQTQSQADELLAQARKKSQQEYDKAVVDLQRDVTQIAIALAQQILEREVKEEDNQHIIDSFFEEVVR